VILLPQGISDRLSPAELDAVLAHEACHKDHRAQIPDLQEWEPGGAEIYDVTFERGQVEWRITPLTADGKISGMGFRALP